MSEPDPELRRRLEALADRRPPRGAGIVLDGARGQADSPAFARRPALMVLAVAVCLALIATTATLVSRTAGSNGGRPVQSAAGLSTTSTVPEPTTAGGVEPSTTLPAGPGPTVTAGGAGPKATTTTPTTAKGTSRTTTPSNDVARTRLAAFSTCPQLVDYARTEALKVVGPYGLPGAGFVAAGSVLTPKSATAAPAAAPPSAADTATDFSGTNNQEAGVDEPDSVKTDGRRIFALAGNKLWATSVQGAPRVVGSMTFDNLSPAELLLAGDRLIVIGYAVPSQADQSKTSQPTFSVPQSRVVILDVTDAGAMKITGSLTFDGSYLSARMVKGVARLVLRSEPARFQFAYPKDGTPQAQQEATDKNKAIVSGSTEANWVPTIAVTDSAGRTTPARPLAPCGESLHPQSFSGFGMLTVLSLDPAKPSSAGATSVMAGGNTVYASTTGLYVSTTAWDHVDNQVVSYSPDTVVSKFDITNPAGATYRVSGRVRGTVLNQYSLSEQDGKLRVATTGSSPGSTESFVTVLSDNGTSLVTVGQVGGLGKGERIYAVRFLGDTAYVVTFRQTDPLYTVDLSDPAHPRVVGELALLGYSAYLHPIGDNLLLGVGQDATEQGRRAGAQATVFDVSDPAHPKLLQRQNFGQGSSSAEFDPHAFLWWPATKLAVLPVTLFSSSGSSFVGAIGVTADTGGVSELGRVHHPETQQGNARYTPMIERSLVIGDSLFTMSQAGLLSSDLHSLADRAWVPFT